MLPKKSFKNQQLAVKEHQCENHIFRYEHTYGHRHTLTVTLTNHYESNSCHKFSSESHRRVRLTAAHLPQPIKQGVVGGSTTMHKCMPIKDLKFNPHNQAFFVLVSKYCHDKNKLISVLVLRFIHCIFTKILWISAS